MGFAENMKTFTNQVGESASARAAAVAEVNESAARLLGQARAFMHRVAREHAGRAEEIHSALAESRRARQSQVRALRHDIGSHLQEARRQLHKMLGEDRHNRHEHLGRLMNGFQEARAALAGDLREAGRVWRSRARR
jgi:hypothetical protein